MTYEQRMGLLRLIIHVAGAPSADQGMITGGEMLAEIFPDVPWADMLRDMGEITHLGGQKLVAGVLQKRPV